MADKKKKKRNNTKYDFDSIEGIEKQIKEVEAIYDEYVAKTNEMLRQLNIDPKEVFGKYF
jgi:LPS sulfotransferase NodH